jgi:hypothetical protein
MIRIRVIMMSMKRHLGLSCGSSGLDRTGCSHFRDESIPQSENVFERLVQGLDI